MWEFQLSGVSPLLFMAFALGLDGFSVSLSIGLHQIRLKQIALIGCIMGLFHVLLPFTGMIIGNFISIKLDMLTSYASNTILVFIGAYMFFSALQKKNQVTFNPHNKIQIVSLALLVSLDGFPVGLSLGLSGIKSFFIICLFGVTAMVFSITGMVIGRKTHRILGVYSEMLGGIILFLFGLKGFFNVTLF